MIWEPYDDFMIEKLKAPIRSKNGGYGVAFILPLQSGGFVLRALSYTERQWKSPNATFATIEEAKLKAEELWTPD